jgi:hypothetical protein
LHSFAIFAHKRGEIYNIRKICPQELLFSLLVGYNEEEKWHCEHQEYPAIAGVLFASSFLLKKGTFMLREPITINPQLVEEIVAREEAAFRRRAPRSHEIHERAKASMPMGVSSSFQAVPPYPLFIDRAQGSHIWDHDGNEYVDFHLAFGSLLVGHAHPVLVEELRDQLGMGTLYSLPCPDTVYLAEELVRRFAP